MLQNCYHIKCGIILLKSISMMTDSEFNNHLVHLKDQLNRYALRLTANKDDAQDLLQDTFLKAFTHRHQFEESTNLKAWAYTIMKNTFINNYRKSVKQNTTFDNTKDLFFLSRCKDIFDNDPASVYSEKEIRHAINRLDDHLRVPFEMLLAGYSYEEITGNLRIKLGTVKSRLFFARQRLAIKLQDYN